MEKEITLRGRAMLVAENQQLKAQVQMLNQELMNRAAPTIGNFIDAVNNLLGLAANGNQAAGEVLRQLTNSIVAARDSTSSVAIVRNGH